MIGSGSLVNPDADGELCRYLNQFLPVYDAQIHGDPHAWQSGRLDSVGGHRTGVDLDLPRYPPPPTPRINTLYWPTGASRWARGYFLVKGDNLIAGLAFATPFTLNVTNTGPGGSWDCGLYVLSPRPLSGAGGFTAEDLWLIPVVDERYFWQFTDVRNLTTTADNTWSQLLAYLGVQLDVFIVGDAPVSAYHRPDPEELSRKYVNAAAVLDAVAHSVGARIVRSPSTGVVTLMTFAQSAIIHDQNSLDVAHGVIAGGELMPGPVPQTVTTVFRKYREHHPYGNGECYSVETAQTATSMPIVPLARKVILTTCYADFTSGSGTPDNAFAVNSLAAKIAADYYLSLTQRHDVTIWGSVPWQPTAFDDHILWAFGAPGEYEHQVQTRIQSPPYNMAVEQQLQQDFTLDVISSPAWGYFTGNQPQGSFGNMAVCRYSGTTQIDTELRIKVWDTLKNVGDSSLTLRTRTQAHWSDDDNLWISGAENCEPEEESNLPEAEE